MPTNENNTKNGAANKKKRYVLSKVTKLPIYNFIPSNSTTLLLRFIYHLNPTWPGVRALEFGY